jgi:hypothetical protein
MKAQMTATCIFIGLTQQCLSDETLFTCRGGADHSYVAEGGVSQPGWSSEEWERVTRLILKQPAAGGLFDIQWTSTRGRSSFLENGCGVERKFDQRDQVAALTEQSTLNVLQSARNILLGSLCHSEIVGSNIELEGARTKPGEPHTIPLTRPTRSSNDSPAPTGPSAVFVEMPPSSGRQRPAHPLLRQSRREKRTRYAHDEHFVRRPSAGMTPRSR